MPQMEISFIYTLYIEFMVAGALPRNSVSVEEWLAATTFVK